MLRLGDEMRPIKIYRLMNINHEALKFLQSFSDSEQVYMLNYLKYKSVVEATGLSGKETYQKYMLAAVPFFDEINAQIVFKGEPKAMILGPENEELWDEVLIVRYETKNEFLKLMGMKDYPFQLRAMALADSRLIMCS